MCILQSRRLCAPIPPQASGIGSKFKTLLVPSSWFLRHRSSTTVCRPYVLRVSSSERVSEVTASVSLGGLLCCTRPRFEGHRRFHLSLHLAWHSPQKPNSQTHKHKLALPTSPGTPSGQALSLLKVATDQSSSAQNIHSLALLSDMFLFFWILGSAGNHRL